MDIPHLTVRSGYSFYQSMIQIEAYVQKAKQLKFTSLALTEENHFFSAIPFYNACIKEGIKPILVWLFIFLIKKKISV